MAPNRQDAALQAGHFNDFVFLLTLRAGLIGALQASNGELNEEQLADAVFKALGLTNSMKRPSSSTCARRSSSVWRGRKHNGRCASSSAIGCCAISVAVGDSTPRISINSACSPFATVAWTSTTAFC
ncbi:hypothetical protein ACWJKU_06585 [Methylocaldum sp. MU1018]